MGNIIQIENGIKTVYVNGQDITSLSAETNTYYVGVDLTSGYYEKLNPDGSITNFEAGSILSTTYADLLNSIINATLVPGAYYEISDFKTVYDTPDFYIDQQPKDFSVVITGESATLPIIVLATSPNTISNQARFVNDSFKIITYDYTFNQTEITSTPAFGRITSMIDEFGNRTSYDHANINFIRYLDYSKNNLQNGLILDYDCTTGLVVGDTGTTFTSITPSTILIMDTKNSLGFDIGVRVFSVVDDSNLYVDVDPSFSGVIFAAVGYQFYDTATSGLYDSYKELYVGQRNQNEYTTKNTFGTGSKNNYIGDFPVWSNSGNNFILPNNVFGDYSIDNNLGLNCYNNDFSSGFANNQILGLFFGNKTSQNFQSNQISLNCYNNVFGANCNKNVINSDCVFNVIGNQFTNNNIGFGFSNNVVGDDVRYNKIGVKFDSNIIGNNFGFGPEKSEGNVIGNACKNNIFNSNIYKNFIGDVCEFNTFSQDFVNNKIGNDCKNNSIGINFLNNTIGNDLADCIFGDYCENNFISNGFSNNIVKDYFKLNIVQTDLSGVNFISATHVYGDYNCTIFKRGDGTNRLSYVDSGDTLTIDNVDA